MTYEINSDFDQIILNSTYLVNTNQTVTLSITKNCTTTTIMDIDVVDTLIEITPEDIAQVDIFLESPYYFKLVIVQEDGTIITETLCRYIQPDPCEYIDLYKTTDNMEKILAHQALLMLNDCDQCSCSGACLFYANITEISCNDCTCGCS